MRQRLTDHGVEILLLASHQPTFTLLQQLLEELVPDADVSIKWGTIADDLAGIPQSRCVLRFSPSAEVPLQTLRKIMTAAVERKRAG